MNNARLTGISLLVGFALWLAGQAIAVRMQTASVPGPENDTPMKKQEPDKKKLRFPRR